MKLLAFDAATPVFSVALWEGRLVYSCYLDRGLTHSETLLPAILQALDTCGWSLREIDRLAVTIGPGSFTGLRIGAATVQGLALGADLPCVGVSTLEAMAQGALLAGALRVGERAVPVLDARRGQVYTAGFLAEQVRGDVRTGEPERTPLTLTRLTPDSLRLFDELVQETPDPFVLVEGHAHFDGNALSFVPCGGAACAAGAAWLGARAVGTVPYHQCQPLYLRRP